MKYNFLSAKFVKMLNNINEIEIAFKTNLI